MDSFNLLIESNQHNPEPKNGPVYNTPEGHVVVRKILAECLPPSFEPHNYQIDGICPAMDGEDVLATMVTGTGNTGSFILLMLVIRVISQDPTLALQGANFSKDPAIIVVCPTKALQADMVP